MVLLNPYALAWLPLVALLLLVARRRATRPRKAVANLYMWRRTPALDPARLAFNRLRRHRLLALQIAFMIAVIAALARPAITWHRQLASSSADSAPPTTTARTTPSRRVDPVRVLLLSRSNFFLEQALQTNPALTVDRERRPDIRYDVVVCDACGNASTVPGDPGAGGTGVNAADGLLTLDASDSAPTVDEPLTVADSEHPIAAALASLAVDGVTARPARRAGSGAIGGNVVLRAGDVPVLLSSETGARRVVFMNLDLSSGSLPLSPAFPVLMANVMDWLSTQEDVASAPGSARVIDRAPARVFERFDGDVSRAILIVALALLLLEWRLWPAAERRRPAFACRTIVVALTALGAAGLQLPFGDSPQHVMFAVDRSASLPDPTQAASLARINAMAAAMRPDDRAGVVAFGLDAAVERPLGSHLEIHDVASTISPAGTAIDRALRIARESLPRDGARRIVLVSDGRATRGDTAGEVARAAADGIRIDVLPADAPAADRPLMVKSMGVPDEVRVGEPFSVSAEIAGPPGARTAVTIASDRGVPLSHEVDLGADGTASVRITDRRSDAGIHFYRAAIDGDDATGTGAAVVVTGVPRVLYVGGAEGPIAASLAAGGFHVTRLAPSAVPASPVALAEFDTIVLDDVRADRLTPAGSDAIADFVEQDGGGLLLLGAPGSLDVGGYANNRLGRVLPIDVSPRAGRRSPTMGLVVAFDKSGSMADLVSGVAKIELAREAARKVLDAVRPTDAVGVIAFDSAPTVVSPLTRGTDPRTLAGALRAINPGGSTAISPALTQAAAWLRGASVTRRHVLLLSDGRTPAADAARLREVIAAGGFELSVIAVGADADRAFLESLASSTGGRAYFPEDLRQLPMLAAREAARAAGGGIVEERFRARAAAHPIAAGIARDELPFLAGYVVAALKPGAEPVLLSHLDDPILAAWRFGLGRVAVYTADLRSPWSAGVRRWPAFDAFWLQTARWIGKRAADRGLRASIVDRPDGVRLVLDADDVSGEPIDGWNVRATVRGAGGRTENVELASSSPGRYEAPLATASPGAYVVSIVARAPGGATERRAIKAFYWSANRERRATGADMRALGQMARATGGRMLGPADNPFDEPRPRAYRDVWNVLAAAALVLFLLDVALRRGFLTRGRSSPERAVASQAAA